MIKTILLSVLLCLAINASAQQYTQRGNNTFVEVDTSTTKMQKSQSIETEFIWIDKSNVSHKIWLSKNGHAFIKLTSKKTGNEYNKYLSEELSRAICKKLGRTYIENPNKL